MKVKSQFASLVFTGTFGPFGLFYSNSIAALIMVAVWLVSVFAVFNTYVATNLDYFIHYGGASILWLIFIYIASPIIGIFTVIKYNNDFSAELEEKIQSITKKMIEDSKAEELIITNEEPVVVSEEAKVDSSEEDEPSLASAGSFDDGLPKQEE